MTAPCPHGCPMTLGVHDFGCRGRLTVFSDPALRQLYFTQTVAESQIAGLVLQRLLLEAGMDDWDYEEVSFGNEAAWFALLSAVRHGLEAHEQPPVRIEWDARAEAPALVMREG